MPEPPPRHSPTVVPIASTATAARPIASRGDRRRSRDDRAPSSGRDATSDRLAGLARRGQRLLEVASRGEARRRLGREGALDRGDERVGQIGSAIAQPRPPAGAVRRLDLGPRRAFDRIVLA